LDVEGFNLSQTSPEANLIISDSTLVIEEGGLIKRDTPDLPYKVIIRAGGGSVWRLGNRDQSVSPAKLNRPSRPGFSQLIIA
jgi:hypothetical protein